MSWLNIILLIFMIIGLIILSAVSVYLIYGISVYTYAGIKLCYHIIHKMITYDYDDMDESYYYKLHTQGLSEDTKSQ